MRFLMLGLGLVEIFFLLIILLCFFSPKEIPELARLILKGIYEIKNVFSKLENKINLPSSSESSNFQKEEKLIKDQSKKTYKIPPIKN